MQNVNKNQSISLFDSGQTIPKSSILLVDYHIVIRLLSGKYYYGEAINSPATGGQIPYELNAQAGFGMYDAHTDKTSI